MKITWGQDQPHELVTVAQGPASRRVPPLIFNALHLCFMTQVQWDNGTYMGYGLGTWNHCSLTSHTPRGCILDLPLPCLLVPCPALLLTPHTCPMTTATPNPWHTDIFPFLIPNSYHSHLPPAQSQGRLRWVYTSYAILGGGMATWLLRTINVSQKIWRVNGGARCLPISIPDTEHMLVWKLQSLRNPHYMNDCCSGPVGREGWPALTTAGHRAPVRWEEGTCTCMLICRM